MTKEELIRLKQDLLEFGTIENKMRDLYLKGISKGSIEGPLVGIPNIDKPWLKYYNDDAIVTNDFQGNCIEYLEDTNKTRLFYTAIEYFNKKITYNELFEKIDIVSKAFMEMGINEGDIVTVALPNTPENTIAVYAINKIGAIANIVDLRLKGDKLKDAINKTNSKLMIASDMFIENLDEVISETTLEDVVVTTPVESLNKFFKFLYNTKSKKYETQNFNGIKWKDFYEKGLWSNKESQYESKADDTFCIVYTSGTTGDAKGVMLTNKNFNSMAEQLKNCGFGVEAGHVFMNQVPPFLVFNTLVAGHFPLSRGVRMRMFPEYRPDIFYKNISKYKINHTVAGPADWGSFADNEKESRGKNYEHLISAVSGSDKFNEEKKEIVNDIFADGNSKTKVTEGYGMTEVGAAAVTNLPQVNVKNSVGIPLPSVNICIYDNDNDTELGYNQVGEICFSGPTVMKGYYNKPEATAEVLKDHGDGKIWMHSGDLGYMDENGVLFLKGRLKRIIVRFDGFKVSPLDIEKVVDEMPMIKDCCAVGIDDKEHVSGAIPVVFAVLKEGACLEKETSEIKEEIMNACKKELSDKYIPKDVVIVDELPLTPVGKVDYRELTKEYENTHYVKKR